MSNGEQRGRFVRDWGWSVALLVIAVRRGIPFWAEAGVPAAIRASPGEALDAARGFLEEGGTNSLPEMMSRVVVAMDRIAAHYGEGEMLRLDAWVSRHFHRSDGGVAHDLVRTLPPLRGPA